MSLLVSVHQSYEAAPAKDMVALELLGAIESVKTDGTVERVFKFLECYFSHYCRQQLIVI